MKALFSVLLSTAFSVLAGPGEPTWRGQSIAEFSPGEEKTFGWRVVDDGVMGGLSKGKLDMTSEGTVRFSGDLSLKNNGGFSMFESKPVKMDLSNDLGLLLRVKGDGRSYQARMETDARWQGRVISFSAEFESGPGEWVQVKIPFTEFRGGWRGRSLDEEIFDPSKVQSLAILLGDKKEAPFDLEIDWIRTYGKGQGKGGPVEAASREKDALKQLIPTARGDERFTTFLKALDAAGLTVFFQWDNPLTVFAPTNAAFANLPDGVLEDLLRPENKEQLVAVLSHHVSPGRHGAGDGELKTIEGSMLSLTSEDGQSRVNGAAVLAPEIDCLDGLIHAVDQVLIPSSLPGN